MSKKKIRFKSQFVHLQMNALCTIYNSGAIVLTGFDPEVVLSSGRTVVEEHTDRSYTNIPSDYEVTNTLWWVLKLILGNSKLSNKWRGINQ